MARVWPTRATLAPQAVSAVNDTPVILGMRRLLLNKRSNQTHKRCMLRSMVLLKELNHSNN